MHSQTQVKWNKGLGVFLGGCKKPIASRGGRCWSWEKEFSKPGKEVFKLQATSETQASTTLPSEKAGGRWKMEIDQKQDVK